MKPIFLSYSRQDSERARELYRRLKRAGFQIWFDEESLLPGQVWEVEIKKAVQNSALVIVLLSTRSVSRQGYLQKEIRTALEFMEQIPQGRPYLIPVKLDDCEIPGHLTHIHVGTLYDEVDFQRLLKALNQYVGSLEPVSVVPANYAKYVNEFEDDELLILPGYGAARIRVAQHESTIDERLGVPIKVDTFPASEFGGKISPASKYYDYRHRGISVLVQEGIIISIFLYGPENEGYNAFEGATPEGISVTSTRNDIEAVFGRPTSVGGDGVIDYWTSYDPIGLFVTYRTLDVNDLTAPVRTLGVTAPGG